MKLSSAFTLFICIVPTLSFTQVLSGGGEHSLAICDMGTVEAWGLNANGQLGNGTATTSNIPVKVNGLTGIIAVSAGNDHSLALKNDGTVWAFGKNNAGQLGNGTTIDNNVPVVINSLSGIIAIAAGWEHSLALKNDGTVWAWGKNLNGQLGDGTTTDKIIPTQISGFTGITAIAAGWEHSLALKSDGTAWAWGQNDHGELGDGTTISKSIPVQVSTLVNISSIGGYANHSLGLKSDGTVWAWGWNNYGQLGDNTMLSSEIPVQVHGIGNVGFLTDIIAIAGGDDRSLALKNDGTLWNWGYNAYGQLGDGTTISKNTPVEVGGLTSIVSIAGGYEHSFAVRNIIPSSCETKLSSWGKNINGQLGDGTITDKKISVPVIGLCSIGKTFSLTATGGTICLSDSVQLFVTANTSTGITYTWQPSTNLSNPAIANPYAYPVTTTTYTVTGMNASGCKSTAIATVTVSNNLALLVSADTSICAGANAQLKASGGLTYLWSPVAGLSNPAIANPVANPLVTTTYQVVVSSGSCTGTKQITITVNPIPVITVNNATACAKQEVILTATGGTTYLWSTKATTPKIMVTPSISTTYTVTGTQAGCSNVAVAVVSVYLNPVTSFYPNIREISEDEPLVVFYNTTTGKNLLYNWNFGDDSGTSNTSTQVHPSHIYSHPATYTICLKATDSIKGCVDSTCKKIIYQPQWTIYVPNAFTPGNAEYDMNNVFYAYGTNILKFRMLIFDRWGNQIFESNDLYKGWDGKVKNETELSQEDIYVWKIDITDVFNKEHQYIGHVTLTK